MNEQQPHEPFAAQGIGRRRFAVLLGGHDTIAALQSQHGTYRLETVTPGGERRYERIAALSEVVPYAFGIERLIAIGAQPDTRIISFTVTEGGYYLDAQDRLDDSAPDIAADIEHVTHGVAGTTIYGALTTILRARHGADAGPVTLLCCDNLRHNGTRSRSGLLQFLARVGDHALRQWVENQTTSPDSMKAQSPNSSSGRMQRTRPGLDASPANLRTRRVPILSFATRASSIRAI